MKTWLLIDCNYVCWRAGYAMGSLSYDGFETGIAYGFLREVVALTDRFLTPHVLFAFDSRKSKRRKLFPGYKRSRKQGTPEQQEIRRSVFKQIDVLRSRHLPYLGFKNIFQQKGYEADDVIASLCQSLPDKDKKIIVSSDEDLFQLLSKRVAIWNPGKAKLETCKTFMAFRGIKPKQWALVKAIAGCNSDDIPGIVGVGETSAIKYIRGELDPNSCYYRRIAYGPQHTKLFLQLTTLPLEGTRTFKIRPDEVTHKRWNKHVHKLGMTTLEDHAPTPDRFRVHEFARIETEY